MEVFERDGKQYRIPGQLNDFQLEMYLHLIHWKWAHLTTEPGYYKEYAYDAFLPDSFRKNYDPLYPSIKERFLSHQRNFHFKSHLYLGHMASSQAACANLFLPLLMKPEAAARILSCVKPDLEKIAIGHLDHGFRIEFWDEPDNTLNDHTPMVGTDADIAIAYYDHGGELNLWMIEHKLTEPGFTTCGGYRSKGRTEAHVCSPAAAIVDKRELCFYHSRNHYRYWDITLGRNSPFNIEKIRSYRKCPFMDGTNQLWRNQLLATSIEGSTSPRWPYKRVYFSVVYHPKNHHLTPKINEFTELIGNSDRFFAFTSDQLTQKALEDGDPDILAWARWYRELYYW